MADIELKCPKCSKTMTVSEFADVNALTCNACGEPFKKSEDTPIKTEKSKHSIKLAAQVEVQENSDSNEPTKWQISQQAARDNRPKRKFELTHLLWSAILFFVIGGIMGYLRYSGGYLANHTELVRLYGPIIIITIHIFVLLNAFKDSVFQGTLCFLIPFYSLYYLFFVSDNFYLRAIAGGLLIGIGQDSMGVFYEWAQAGYKWADDFISSGGGTLNTVPRAK